MPSGMAFNIRANHSTSVHIGGFPLVPTTTMCNCFTSPQNVMLGSTNNQAVVSAVAHNNETMASPVINDQSLNTAEFFCAGCSYPEYQDNLSTVRRFLIDNQICYVNITPEPLNTKDKNALAIIAKCGWENYKLGYIPVQCIPKVYAAISKTEIVSARVDRVRKVFVRRKNKAVWKAWIVILKRGKWLVDIKNFAYNGDLSTYK